MASHSTPPTYGAAGTGGRAVGKWAVVYEVFAVVESSEVEAGG